MLRADVRLASRTIPGHRHKVEGLENEDAVFVTADHPLFDALLLVADGMGGHPHPREAAEAAVAAAREFLFERRRLEAAADLSGLLVAAVKAAHGAVRNLRAAATAGGGAARSPGTTLSIAAVADGILHVAHVGDGSVFLSRGGRVRALAGGEDRRTGNRPQQFLGQEGPLEPEQAELAVEAGDRVLLCTDGLTRYFQEAGPEALERVLAREGVEIESVAGQLTAHSRHASYDDDTTVALAEITALRREARRRPAGPPERAPQEEPMERTAAHSRGGSPLLAGLLGALVGAGLLAGGYLAGRASVPREPSAGAAPAGGAASAPVVTPEQLRGLPAGSTVLLDTLNGRAYTLTTAPQPPPQEPVELQALKVGTDNRLTPAGRFRLDAAKNVLIDAQGRRYPIHPDVSSGAIRVLRGGTLVVRAARGARVFVDGRAVGSAPATLTLPAGPHRVRVESPAWTNESEIEVLPGRVVTVSLGPA